jgi:hypothetical protein
MKTSFLALLFSTLTVTTATAQARRTVQSLQLWPETQAELTFKNGDYLLLNLHGERNTDYDDIVANRSLGLDLRRLQLGYEHFWGPNWSAGATVRYDGSSGAYDYVTPELFGRHRSQLGPLTFGQRLSLERYIPVADPGFSGTAGPDGETWTRLRVDLDKIFPVGSFVLRPRLSYEAATHLRLQKEESDLDERTIQYTSLRAEIGLHLNSWLDVTPWFAYRTQYLETLPQYDANGQQTSGGKLNAVFPTLGVEVRFTIFPSHLNTERTQLPTQH